MFFIIQNPILMYVNVYIKETQEHFYFNFITMI